MQTKSPHSENERMSLDDFSLACECVVDITLVLLSLFLQSSQMSHRVGGGKTHSETRKHQRL